MMTARVVVRSVGVTFCVEVSYFGLCNVLCTEGLRSLGDFPR